MATVVVKSNPAQGTDVFVRDLGLSIPAAGGSITFTEFDDILDLQESRMLRAFATDAVFGTTSTIVLNDGTTDIAQANALVFLASLNLPLTVTSPITKSLLAVGFDQAVALDNNARLAVTKAGVAVGTRRGLNFIQGSNVTITTADNPGAERVDVTIAAAGGGGGGSPNAGIATIDFGAFPGGSDAVVNVTGQAAILATSIVMVQLHPTATADHTEDEHVVETIRVGVSQITPGVGFTIRAVNTNDITEPAPWNFTPERMGRWNSQVWVQFTPNERPRNTDTEGLGTLVYGQWSVQWWWV